MSRSYVRVRPTNTTDGQLWFDRNRGKRDINSSAIAGGEAVEGKSSAPLPLPRTLGSGDLELSGGETALLLGSIDEVVSYGVIGQIRVGFHPHFFENAFTVRADRLAT